MSAFAAGSVRASLPRPLTTSPKAVRTEFGDPKELAQLFADELATQETTRAAYFAFAALALAGAGFGVGWHQLVLHSNGGAEHHLGRVRSGRDRGRLRADRVPADLVRGRVALDPARAPVAEAARRSCRRARAARAADENRAWFRRRLDARVLGLRRRLPLHVSGLGSRSRPASAALALTLPLAAAAAYGRRAAAVQSAAPGEAGDMFDDFPRPPAATAVACLLRADRSVGDRLSRGGLAGRGPAERVRRVGARDRLVRGARSPPRPPDVSTLFAAGSGDRDGARRRRHSRRSSAGVPGFSSSSSSATITSGIELRARAAAQLLASPRRS